MYNTKPELSIKLPINAFPTTILRLKGLEHPRSAEIPFDHWKGKLTLSLGGISLTK